MDLAVLERDLSICRVARVGAQTLSWEFFFLARTDEELSLVCRTEDVPPEATARDDGWRAFRVCGVLDFSLTGILAELSGVLAGAGIGIFAVSTYNTDYILVRREDVDRAAAALSAAGHRIV